MRKIYHDGGNGGAEMCRLRIDEIKSTSRSMLGYCAMVPCVSSQGLSKKEDVLADRPARR